MNEETIWENVWLLCDQTKAISIGGVNAIPMQLFLGILIGIRNSMIHLILNNYRLVFLEKHNKLYSAAGIREMLLPFWDGGNTMRDGGCLYMKYVDQEVNVLFSFAAVEYKRIK